MNNNIHINVTNIAGIPLSSIKTSTSFHIVYTHIENKIKLISNTLFNTNTTTDKEGGLILEVSPLLGSAEFARYYKKHNLQIGGTFEIIASINSLPSTGLTATSTIHSFQIDLEPSPEYPYLIFSQDFSSKNNITIPSDVGEDYSLKTLESKFKEAESLYLSSKYEYEENLKVADTTTIFDQLQMQEPNNWENVILRILEFEEFTLNAGLRFTKKVGLTEEFKRLDSIYTSILYLKDLYPNIKLKAKK